MQNIQDSFQIDFIGIGAAKSATTWLTKRLREHPSLCMSEPKETSFFFSYNFTKGAGWYAKHFIHCNKDQTCGEFSPQYLTAPEVSNNIKVFAPNAKLIICLRDPVERFLSAYRFTRASGRHNKTLTLENITTDFKEELERGMYHKYLKAYFELFPREHILVLFTEDIYKNGLSALQKTFRFLGVDDSFIPPNLEKKENVSSEAQTRFPRLNKLIFRWHKKITLGPLRFLVPIFKIFGMHIFARNIRSWNKKIGAPVASTHINQTIKDHLSALYKEDAARLEQLIGSKTPWKI